MGAVEITPVGGRRDLEAFVALPYSLVSGAQIVYHVAGLVSWRSLVELRDAGWSAETGTAQGIPRTAAACRSAGWL
jgi:hypothetical protein